MNELRDSAGVSSSGHASRISVPRDGQLQLKSMEFSVGVTRLLLVVKITRYCRYCPLGLDTVPPFVTAVHFDQLLSGVAVLPLRVCTVTVVPAGKSSYQLAVPQLADWPALYTAEVYVPADGYDSW
jgi:hypothetical protein